MDKGGAKAERGYPGPTQGTFGLHFQLSFQYEGLIKVTCSHLHSKCDSILETVQDSHCYCRPLIGSDIWPIR